MCKNWRLIIDKWTLTLNYVIPVIEESLKKLGDGKFAYWSDGFNESQIDKINSFKEMAEYMYDNSKIYAEELLNLADQNPKQLKQSIARDATDYSTRLKKAVEVIALESDQVDALGWVLIEHKNTQKKNLESLFRLILNLLDQIDDSFDSADAHTLKILNAVSTLNYESMAQDMVTQTETLLSGIKKLNSKASLMTKDKRLDFLDDEIAMNDWKDYFRDLGKKTTESIQKNQYNKSMGMNNSAFIVLLVVGLSAVAGLCFLYFRLQTALNKNNK